MTRAKTPCRGKAGPEGKKMDPEKEYREEAERLAQLPVEVQLQILDIHRSTADNRKLSKRDRDAARERVEALERYLGLNKPM
jgi:hypothetical protein